MAVEILDQWAAHFREDAINSDKVYAIAYTSAENGKATLMRVYGRRDSSYQTKREQASLSGIMRDYSSLIAQKVKKGYIPVPFESQNHGNIPSFRQGLGEDGRISEEGLKKQILSLTERLGLASKNHTNPTMLIMEYHQLRMKVDVWVDLSMELGKPVTDLATLSDKLKTDLTEMLVN